MTMEQINWYPGHMKKTRELIQENLKMVDVVIEVIDARIPISSRNPIIHELISEKKKIIALNKSDLADKHATAAWNEYFKKQGYFVLSLNCMTGDGVSKLKKMLQEIHAEKNKDRLVKKPLRMMIVGIPNVGKSSLINRLTGKKSTRVGNKPGVTRGKQWLNIGDDMQLLDTPGILWPKFEDPNVGQNLAYIGSIKDEVLDLDTLALNLIEILSEQYTALYMARYKLEELGTTPLETMEITAEKRGFLLPGKRIDYSRISRVVLDEFRAGMIGKITLEHPKGE